VSKIKPISHNLDNLKFKNKKKYCKQLPAKRPAREHKALSDKRVTTREKGNTALLLTAAASPAVKMVHGEEF